MMELFAVKEGVLYFRGNADGFSSCPLAKASVYPLDKLNEVEGLLSMLHASGHPRARIVKLRITEELWEAENE